MSKYALGHAAWGICGRSGRKMLLRDMVFDGRYPNMRVDPAWYEGKHPLDYAPRFDDPIALWRPAPDSWTLTSPVLTLVTYSSTTASLSWTEALSDAYQVVSYTVMVRLAGTENDFEVLGEYLVVRDMFGEITTSSLSAVVSLPVPGNLYEFKVVATDSGGLSSQSNIVEMDEAPFDIVGALCNTDPTFSAPGTKTLLFHPDTIAGDLVVLTATSFLHRTGGYPTFPAGWISYQYPGTGGVDGRSISTAWKVAGLGETSADITFATAGTPAANSLAWCAHTFRGQYALEAVISILEEYPEGFITASTLTDPNTIARAISGGRFASAYANAIVLDTTVLVGSNIPSTGAFDAMVNTDTFEISNLVQKGEAQYGTMWCRAYRTNGFELENLLPYSFLNFANWDASLVTVSDADVSGGNVYTNVAQTATTGRHEITETVQLVAGQQYSFFVSMEPENFIWLSVNDGTERGWFMHVATNNVYLDSEIGTGTIPYCPDGEISGGANDEACIFGISFTAAATGPAVLSIGISSVNGVQSQAGAISRNFHLFHAQFLRGFRNQPNLQALRTNGTAVQGVAGCSGRMTSAAYGTGYVVTEFTLSLMIRKANSDPAITRLVPSGPAEGPVATSTDLSTSHPHPNAEIYDWKATKWLAPAYWGGPTKYYFEVTFDVLGTEADTGNSAWRIALIREHSSFSQVSVEIGEDPFEISITRGSSTNLLVNNGTNTDLNFSGFAPLIAGDIIGLSVDYDTSMFRFYKNGAEIGTGFPFNPAAGAEPSGAMLALRAWVFGGISATEVRQLTANFIGPFGGRKPSGFVAYDYENEVP